MLEQHGLSIGEEQALHPVNDKSMEAHKRDHSVIKLRFDSTDCQWMRNKIFIQWNNHPRRRTRGIIMWASCYKGLGYDGRGWAAVRLQSALPILLLIIPLNVIFYHSKSFMISLFTISTTFIGFYEYCFTIYVRVNGCELPHKLGTFQ